MTIQRNNSEMATDFGQPTRRGPLTEGDRVQARAEGGAGSAALFYRGSSFFCGDEEGRRI